MDSPRFVSRNTSLSDEEYTEFVIRIKARYRQSRIKTAVKINTALLEFYWELGREISALRAAAKWGAAFFDNLSLDLKHEFPAQSGFSATNLKYVRRWYLFYNAPTTNRHHVGDDSDMPADFGLVPWRHHIEIFTHSKSIEEALFYVEKTIEENWSRRQLEDNIESDLYRHSGKGITNFSTKLPTVQGHLAQSLLKDPYTFDFVSVNKGYDEIQLENELIRNISKFLLELGQGFAFVGRQMELRMPGGQTFIPDMIFYHIRLKCYVVIELKTVKFEPEFAGKLNFYVTAVDKLLKGDDDNPTIGLLICRSKDRTVVEWSFQDIHKPIGVASYVTKGNMLPTTDAIKEAIGMASTD